MRPHRPRRNRLVTMATAFVALITAATVLVPPAAAAAPSPATAVAGNMATAPVRAAAQSVSGGRYYLSLGDSLAFGYSDVKLGEFEQSGDLSVFTGYTDDLAHTLQSRYPGLQTVNLSCPGETSTTMIAGGCPWTEPRPGLPAGAPLHRPYSGDQLDAATGFLRSHRGQVALVTVSIGSNDILPVARDCMATVPSCPALGPTLRTMRANVARILWKLRLTSPRTQVVVLAPYNPFGFAFPATNILAVPFDLSLAAVALLSGDRVADAFTPINGRYQPSGCSPLVYFCPGLSTDVHPTDAGYAVITTAFEKALR